MLRWVMQAFPAVRELRPVAGGADLLGVNRRRRPVVEVVLHAELRE
jgi:hypothetical protein